MNSHVHIGLTCWKPEAEWSANALCRQAEYTEQLGFHSFWLPENHFGKQAMPSPLTQLAAVAATTTRIQLGTVSYLLPIRHPVQAAEEVAVLDQLCQGRLILGLGRGIQGEVFQAYGIDSKDKRALFAEKLSIMRKAWAGEAFGDNTGAKLSPLPYQTGGPPLWVAAFGPLALKQVAGLGLPYLASPMEDIGGLEANYRQHQQLLEEAGRPSTDTVPVMRTVFVHSQRGLRNQLAAALKKQAEQFGRTENPDPQSWALVGDRHEVRDKISEYRERLGMTHLIASGRLPGLDAEQVVASHLELANL